MAEARARLGTLCQQHPTFTARYNSQFLGCAGILAPYPGVGEAWILASVLADERRHAYFIFRTVRDRLEFWAARLNLHRLQATILATNARDIRWIEALGFKRESVLHAYGPKAEDFLMYVRFPKEEFDGS